MASSTARRSPSGPRPPSAAARPCPTASPWASARIRAASGRLARVRRPSGKPLQDPVRVEQIAPVGAAHDGHVLAGARIDGEIALDWVVLVVLADQLVDVVEVP